MKSLPSTVAPYHRTPEYTQETVPPGLEQRHNTKAGVWARVRVLEGRMVYRILEPEIEEHVLEPGRDGVIEPQVDHQIEMQEPVRFFVEFLK